MKIAVVALICIVLATSCDPTKASVARLRRQTQPASSPVDINSPEFISCFRSCPSTFEYNPVCATNGVTYDNLSRLGCANRCGASTERSYLGTCAPL